MINLFRKIARRSGWMVCRERPLFITALMAVMALALVVTELLGRPVQAVIGTVIAAAPALVGVGLYERYQNTVIGETVDEFLRFELDLPQAGRFQFMMFGVGYAALSTMGSVAVLSSGVKNGLVVAALYGMASLLWKQLLR